MPQLDKFTFAPQVFWLIFLFLFLYFVLLKTGLPRLYKILLFRKKQLESYAISGTLLDQELYFSEKSLERVLNSTIKVYKHVPEFSNKIVDAHLSGFNIEVSKSLSLKKGFSKKTTLSQSKFLRDLNVARLLNGTSFVNNRLSLKNKLLKV